MNAIKKFMQDEEGAAAIEYGLLAALIAAVIIAAVAAIGTNVCRVFRGIATALTTGTYTLPGACT